MLPSLLPGLRDLRTPLSAGYLWLAGIWLALGAPVPATRPTAGLYSAMWDLGSYVGKAGLAVVVSFAAYLVGSFVEIDPLRMWEHGGRPDWLNRIRTILRRVPLLRTVAVFPISAQAENDLISFSKDDLGFRHTRQRDARDLMRQVMLEEQQIATRLQANNTELFGKYDRLIAESAFRINVAPPLVLVLLLVLARSSLPLPWTLILAIAALLYGFMLFRQGTARAIRSRDVILQALIVGVVESRTLERVRSRSGDVDGSEAE